MGTYHSLDLRRRAARYCLKHGSGKTAETFAIGRATAVRWAYKLSKTGDMAIGKVGEYRRRILEPHEDWLRDRIASQSHVSLRKLQAELNDRGIVVGYGVVRRSVHRLGFSFKKAFTQKKPYGLTLRANAGGGGKSRRGLKPRGWSSLMRPGSRPTWPRYGVGANVARGRKRTLHTATRST